MRINHSSPDSSSRLRMAALLDILPLGLVITDEKDQPIITNQMIARIFSYDSSKSLATQLEESLQLTKLSQHCRYSQHSCKPREVSFGERWLRVVASPVLAGQDPVGAVILVDDITSHKIWERSREDFFAIASHELRTPLTAIRGNIALIRDYYGDLLRQSPDLTEILADMHTASIRLIGIVNDFLDASRLEQNRLEFKLQDLDISGLLNQVLGELKKLVDSKTVRLTSKVNSSNSLLVRADRERLRQVLINLAGNAIKHTSAGQITITLTPQEKMLKINIKDTGEGIPLSLQHLLFNKFQQASTKTLTRNRTQGTGMGLYISKLLVERMGGKIWLEESIPGRGSDFAFTLPLVII